jgi:hypothetical protein
MTQFHLLMDDAHRKHMDQLFAAYKADPTSREGKEFAAAYTAMKALGEGREGQYEGKRLGYGRDSYDLSDCAELKVDALARGEHGNAVIGPSHRLIYREFENPFPKVVDGRVVPDENAIPFRQVVAFEHRAATPDPASVAGQRLNRTRGMDATGLTRIGGGAPSGGPQRAGEPTTPHRIPMPRDLMDAARVLHGNAPASGAVNAPNASGQVAAKKAAAPGKSAERTQDT